MTLALANVELGNTTFDQWRVRTNQIVEALRTIVVTVDSNTTVGNCVINGAFAVNTLYAGVLSGGTLGSPANLVISSNTTVNAHIAFNNSASFGSNVDLGLVTNLKITGANTTHRYLVGYPNNEVRFETLAEILNLSDIKDVQLTSFGSSNVVTSNTISSNGAILQYDTDLQQWVVGRFGFNVAANGNIAINQSPNGYQFSVSGHVGIANGIVIGTSTLVANTSLNRVGVNKAAPEATLHVGGAIFADGEVITNYTSDRNFKHNIVELSPDIGLDIVNALKPVSFYWDLAAVESSGMIAPKTPDLDTGLIAQDVYDVLPHVAFQRPDGTWGYHPEKIIPYLILAIHKLQQLNGHENPKLSD